MNETIKIVLSLSLSGSLLICALVFCKPLLKNRLSKCWQYYIWLVVIARLLLPFSPETSFVGALFQEAGRSAAVRADITLPKEQDTAPIITQPENDGSMGGITPQNEEQETAHLPAVPKAVTNLTENLWIVWIAAALMLLIRKITIYQGFVRYIKAGRKEVSDIALLDQLALLGEQVGVKKPVELYTNSLISSPLLLGFFKPCIVLPTADLSDTDFQYIVLHELTHYKRRDMFYKWLVQLTICLHWFNPLAYFMGREISRACELACDEAVIKALDAKSQRAYGDTLLNSIGIGGEYKSSLASVTLNESKELLKERLDAIMTFQKSRKSTVIIAAVLAACFFAGGIALGSYAAKPAWEISSPGQMTNEGLPVMSAQNRNLYEAYIMPVSVTGLLRHNFSPEDVSALLDNDGSTLMSVLDALEQKQVMAFDGAVPAKFAEEKLLAKLPLQPWNVKNACAAIYDAATDTYKYSSGLGGGPAVAMVTASRTDGNKITILYTWYVGDPSADKFKYAEENSGELVMEVTGDNYKYISNKVISAKNISAEKNTKNLSVQQTESAAPQTDIINISSGGQKNITQSGSFEAKDNQILTLTIQSDIKGGTADFFLFSPSGKEQQVTDITIGGSDKTETVTLTAGRWAYNCTGFFTSGEVSIKGQLSAKAGAADDNLTLVTKEYSMANIKSLNISGIIVKAISENVLITRGGETLKVEYYIRNQNDYTLKNELDAGGTFEELVLRRVTSATAGDTERPISITIPDNISFKVISAATSSGNITLKNCSGENVISQTQSGEISISGGFASNVFAVETESGNAIISDFSANEYGIDFQTKSGTITFNGVDCEVNTNAIKKEDKNGILPGTKSNASDAERDAEYDALYDAGDIVTSNIRKMIHEAELEAHREAHPGIGYENCPECRGFSFN